MHALNKALAISAVSALALGLPAANAQRGEEALHADHFVKMCDTDKDGMVSKQEFMTMVEKMYDKQDAKKQGKIDKKQTEALLKELMRGGGGG